MSIYRGIALTVAGSDSGGGAGIQADLKTFAALKVFGTCAVTALTVQNSLGVAAVHPIPPKVVKAQVEAVCDDFRPGAAKTGMLGTAGVVREAASALVGKVPFLVVDPVMVAQSGDSLIEPDAVEAIRNDLLPSATLVTPNAPEAERLAGIPVTDTEGMIEAAHRIVLTGARGVLVKGGHLDGPVVRDVLLWEGRIRIFEDPRIPTLHTHGTGCTLSSAITAELAAGCPMDEAVERARIYLRMALEAAFQGGKGHGCLGHAICAPWVKP